MGAQLHEHGDGDARRATAAILRHLWVSNWLTFRLNFIDRALLLVSSKSFRPTSFPTPDSTNS